MQVFISYSFQDTARFDDVCFAFEPHGITPWSTDEIAAGESLRDRLRSAIGSCGVCVFIATRNSLASAWCQAELGAFWGAGKPVVVYLADGKLDEEEIPRQFQGDKWATTTRELVEAVKRHLRNVTTISPVDRPANLFWLGHDLAWSLSRAVLGQDDPTHLERDLRQALYHLDELGLPAPDARKMLLDAIITHREGGPSSGQEQDGLAESLALARNEIGEMISALQRGFRGFPDRDTQRRIDREIEGAQGKPREAAGPGED